MELRGNVNRPTEFLECGDKSPLLDEATCRLVQKRGHARALQKPSAREYRQLVALLARLVDEIGERENHPLASLMDVLGVLIEKYEDDHVSELV